jgi:CHAT domain-containing protein
VWLVARKHFEVIARPVSRDSVERWSSALQRYAEEGNGRGFSRVLEEAHDGLLSQALRRVRSVTPPGAVTKLIFVPDRAVHALPLSALRDKRRRRHVIEDHTVSVAPSATFYAYSRDRDQELAKLTAGASVLLVGDPAFNPDLDVAAGLERLGGAAAEVTRLGQLYGSAAMKLEPEQATVPEFLRLAQQSVVVHFAGHAVANPDAPFRSLLLLAPAASDSGVLFAEDLLARLHVDRTRLVVLSACSTAAGVTIGPEGLAPLVRPIIASGVPAVIGTLWNVGDQSSGELLVAFHKHFRGGHDADESLRLAQLELLRRKKSAYGSVLVWAPYQLVGHASSPFR